jgi:uncharacterized damage-inducible protein DinB
MLIETLKLLFKRDLEKLKTEIEKYQNDENLWRIEESIANSAGNLCLHLIGNLNTYIGAEFGKTNYIRQRNLEFSLKNIPKAELLQQIDHTMKVVELSLDKLTDAEIKEEYPLLVFKKKTTTEFMLVHLTTHLSYHLGQINYHRRLLDNS